MKHADSSLYYGARSIAVGLFVSYLATAGQVRASDNPDCRARSCWMAAVEGDFAAAINEDTMGAGGGGGLRAGLQRNLGLVALTSEFALSYHVLDTDARRNANLAAVKFGGRLRFLKGIEPGLFMHMGGGRVGGSEGAASIDFAVDAGLSLDFTTLPLLDVGLDAAFNRIFGGASGGVSYATLGIHATIVIEDKL